MCDGRFVTLVPLWVAPNLITMAGLTVNIVTSLVLVTYCPTATEVAPWWTTASCALGLFIYQTLDAIDGKQVTVGRRRSSLSDTVLKRLLSSPGAADQDQQSAGRAV